MAQMIVLLRALVHPREEHRLHELRNGAVEALSAAAGFLGASVWRASHENHDYMLVLQFESPAAAEDALTRVSERGLLSSATGILQGPPEVRRVLMDGSDGMVPDQVAPGHLMSLSVREAGPGYGADLLQEIDDIFQELSNLEGYLGSIRGTNEVIDDEVIGMVFWRTPEAFHRSVSPNALRRIELFQRSL
ncbi:MAG TPA: antibiotic biosynthesis monooxygenase [Fimbriimonadaceae bacterium]|nr:antibiotic biosynthesis monooxygenase [Fimbriimonadaceae bacterium]